MRRLVTLSLTLAAGCTSAPADPGDTLGLSPPAAPSVSARAECFADNVVAGQVTAAYRRAARVRVLYGPDAELGLATPAYAVDGDGERVVPLFGLTPGAINHARVEVTAADGTIALGEDLLVRCDALPAEVPSFTTVSGSSPAGGYLLVSAVRLNSGVFAVIDHAGRLWWYRQTTALGDFRQTSDGNFIFYDDDRRAFREVTPAGSSVRTWTDPLSTDGADDHELQPLADHHALLLGSNVRAVDGGSIIENTVVEMDGAGALVSRFALGDRIGLDETTANVSFVRSPVDTQHANCIEILLDGNLLVSLRHTDTVYKLDRRSGAILWRLGGTRSDFTFVDDPLNGFSHQHFPRRLPNGNLLVLDNGNLHTPPRSRVVEYRLDEASRTATQVWEHRHTPELFSVCCGSATRLPSGNTLTAWGSTGVVEESDPASTSLWELTVEGAIVYRALPIASPYGDD